MSTPDVCNTLFKNRIKGSIAAALIALAVTAHATDVYRADNANFLEDPLAWTNGVTPTDLDIAVWDNAVQLNIASSLNVPTNWAGLRIADPAGAISISGATLTLGASGIDMTMPTNINLALAVPISLAVTQTWSIAAGRTITASGGIGDADALGKQLTIFGPGAFNATLTPTFIGAIQVSGAGTIAAGNGFFNTIGTVILSNGTVTVNGTANGFNVVAADNSTNTMTAIANSGNFLSWFGTGTILLNINAAGRVMTANGDMSAFNGTIRMAPGTGLGSFRANAGANVGGTNITFDLGNNASGSLNKNAGGVQTFSIGALAGGANTVVVSGQAENFNIGYKADSTFSGAIQGGNVSVTKSGPTTLVLAGNNTYGSGTTISNGVLQIGNGGTTGRVGLGSVTNYTTLALNRSDIFAFTNIIAGSGTVSNFGTGTLILTANNTHSGKTVVAAGTLVVPQQTGLGAVPGVFTADHLTLNGGALGATNNFSLSDSTRGITLGANGGSLAPSAGVTLTIPNAIAGSGSLTVTNAGVVSLTAVNGYTGKTILKAGTLNLGAEEPMGPNPTPLFVADQLTLDGGALRSTATFAVNDANRGVTIASTGGTFLPDAATTLTLSTPVAGSGTLTASGAGTVTLNAANPLNGNIAINSGSLALGASGTIATVPSIAVASGATFDVTAAGISLAGGQTLGGNGTVSGNVTSGAGSTLSAGTSIGKLNITGNVTFSGGTNLVEINSTTNDVIQITGNLVLSGTSAIRLNAQSLLNSGRRVLIRYSGTLSGGGTFALLSAPAGTTLDTSVANEVAIILNIVAANITWKGDGTLNRWDTTTPNWTNGVAAVLFSDGDNVTFNDAGSQSPAVNIVSALQPRSVTVNAAGNYTFSGAGKITGVGGLTKNNSGTLTLLTGNDYFGPTLLSSGLVQVGNGGTGGSLGTGAITNNTTLVFNLPATGTNSGDLSGSGSLTLLAGSLTLAGNGTYSGATTNAASATLRVGAGGGTGSLGTGAVQNEGDLIFNRTGTLTNSGAISGAGTLTKQGSGTVALSANNSYVGATTISAGTLQIGAGGASGSLGTAGSVTDNGTLAFSRSDDITNAVLISGSGALAQRGPGTLTVLSDNSYSGGTIITGGRLQLGDGVSAGGLGSGAVTNNTTLIVNQPVDVFMTNVLRGSGTLVKVGPNTLRFTNVVANANTYSGGTVISNGIIRLGPDAGGDPGQANANSLGSGPVTFYGGTLRVYNHDSTLAVPTAFVNGVIAPANQSGLIFIGQNGAFAPATATGSGSLMLDAVGNRNNVGGNWSGYSGLLTLTNTAQFRLGNNTLTNTTIDLLAGTTMYSVNGNNQVMNLGELTGDGTVGSGDQSSQNITWNVGGKGASGTFGGAIGDSGITSVRKVGAGTWTLTGVNTYTGTTTVSNGVLALATNALAGDGSIDFCSAITVVSPAAVNVTGRNDGTLNVGVVGLQILTGNGTVQGQLNVSFSGALNPGFPVGVLNVTSNATLNGSTSMELNRGGSPTSDRLAAQSVVFGGTLTVVNVGPPLHVNDTFDLFDGALSGGFSTIVLPNYYTWDTNNLAVNGTIKVTAVMLPKFTSIVMNGTSFDISGGGGIPFNPYSILTSTNLLAPISGWSTLTTGNFDGSGNFFFSDPVDPAAPVRFYLLQTN